MIWVSNYLRESRIVHSRIVFSLGVVAVLATLLIARLAYLQIFQHQRFSTQAQDNRINLAPLAPVRGMIHDRNGVVLAQNFRVYNLEILPDQIEDMPSLLAQLGQLVTLTEEDLSRFDGMLKRGPSFLRQTLRTNLTEEEAARVAVNQHRYPGVRLRARLQRHYPQGDLSAHVIGYVGRISADDLEKIDPQAYRGMGYIGRTGIEARYESVLHGKPGFERVETNAHGRVVRSLEQSAPEAGQSVHLSLDMQLQRKSIEALQGYEGAIVALEPASGEVLAFASAPAFNPNLFVNGISKKDYAQLRDSAEKPLINRALYSHYAPGSTIKGFMLLVGLENGIDPARRNFCPGWYSLPNRTHRYRDWKREGHGSLDAHDSIVQSCDVYFYQLARELGIDTIHRGLSRFGFGQPTGLDLAGEPGGLLPSTAWKRRARNEAWYPGETVITGIGQGYMLTTPLQLATATATLANRGKRVVPRLLVAVENPRTRARQAVAAQPASWTKLARDDSYQYVIDSMREVVHGSKGTARAIGRGIRYPMAGKTGTSQVKSVPQGERYVEAETEKKFRDHSLFLAFAPIDQPKIAIAVVVEHAGSGSRVAAPIARKLIDYYLLERLGLYADEVDVVEVAEGVGADADAAIATDDVAANNTGIADATSVVDAATTDDTGVVDTAEATGFAANVAVDTNATADVTANNTTVATATGVTDAAADNAVVDTATADVTTAGVVNTPPTEQ